VHAALGRRFFVLLNGHDGLRVSELEQPAVCQTTPLPALPRIKSPDKSGPLAGKTGRLAVRKC